MQREVVTVSTQCCNDKMHFALHEPSDEVHVARETI
jgi:hypothetical protein